MDTQASNCTERVAIVLPSLDPDKKFAGVVQGLIENGFKHIVIVDDGSNPGHRKYFEDAAKNPECTVLRHYYNKGKGVALKDAFAYVSKNMPGLEGVCTIDGDGQHLIGDIIKCCEVMLENNDKVVLGCRDFDLPGVPARSVTGNKFTAGMLSTVFNIQITDSQTGLRAIPTRYLDLFCEIPGDRFEYETNMLIYMKHRKIDFIQNPIETVYDPEDYSSHYNAVKDSWRIFKVMFKGLFVK